MNSKATLNSYLYWLKELDPDIYSDQLGPKISGAIHLTHARFSTPPAFLLTHQAFTQIVFFNQLTSQVFQRFKQAKLLDPASVEKTSQHLVSAFVKAKLPDNLAYQIVDFYSKFSHSPHVLISIHFQTKSGRYIRLTDQDSIITKGDANLLQSIKLAWSTLYSVSNIFYLLKHRLNPLEISVNLLVQKLEPPLISGTIITSLPQADKKDQILIEALYGLPQPLLDGSISPDVYRLNRHTGRIIYSHLSLQTSQLVPSHHQTQTQTVPHSKQTRAKLNQTQLETLLNLARKLHQYFYFPQLSYWTYSQSKFSLLSTQPFAPQDNLFHSLTSLDELKLISTGQPASGGIASGIAIVVEPRKKITTLNSDQIVVLNYLSPEMIPFVSKAAAIVTQSGSLVSHAAIIARELNIPCVVAAPEISKLVTTGDSLTVNGSTGDVYLGTIHVQSKPANTAPQSCQIVKTATKIFLTTDNSTTLDRAAQSNLDGVLPLVADHLYSFHGLHPKASISQRNSQYFRQHLTQFLLKTTRSFGVRPVFYQLSNLGPTDLSQLKEGQTYEKHSLQNPYFGFRGALRHAQDPTLLNLELQAFKSARTIMKSSNLHLIIPWCSRPQDLKTIKKHLTSNGLVRSPSFKLFVSLDFPSNLTDISTFKNLGVDGFSINYRTLSIHSQGIDPQNQDLLPFFQPNHTFVQQLVLQMIHTINQLGLSANVIIDHSASEDLISKIIKAGVFSLSTPLSDFHLLQQTVYHSELELVKNGNNPKAI